MATLWPGSTCSPPPGEEKKAFFEAHFDLRELEVEYGGQDDHAYDPQRYFATHPRILG